MKNIFYMLTEPLTTFNLQEKYGFDELSGLIHLNKSLEELIQKILKL